MLERRAFLAVSALGIVPSHLRGLLDPYGPERAPAGHPGAGAVGRVDPSATFPSQDPALVLDVVAKSHFDYDRVEELVTEYPELAKASIDWGFGDWESALGAASHTGRREIATLLLEHGARPTLFSATMLGHLDAVRAMIEAQPGVQRTPGPHGITMLAHARFGGDEAAPVREYLESLGDADLGPRSEGLPVGSSTSDLLGAYRYGSEDDEVLEATDRDGTPFIGRRGGTARGLTHLGELDFHPAGAPSVRISFRPSGVAAQTVRVRAGGLDVTARREA